MRQYAEPSAGLLERKAAEMAPEKLTETLCAAFEKAVGLVIQKGSGPILRAARRQEQTYRVNAYAADLAESRKHLRAFSKAADRAGMGSQLLSGAAGVGMGLMGMAIPDVPLLTALLLKCVYETAESFGCSCEGEAERIYALRLIEAALSEGEDLRQRDRALEAFAQTGAWPAGTALQDQVRATARQLSAAVLYGKALQSVPVVGAVGGAGDWICLRRVRRYARIKYEKRFLTRRRLHDR